MSIYEEIQQERARQDERWGGPDGDDHNTLTDWMAYITCYTGKALFADTVGARRRFIQVAALAVAAVEWIDRKLARESE